MLKQILKISWILPLALLSALTSCDKEDTTTADAVDDYVDEVIFRMEESGNLGRFGCYELVFPITVVFPDASTQEVADYEALRDAIKDWKEANPDATERPTFDFPIEVLSEEGEVISVEDETALRELGAACGRRYFGGRGHRGHGGRCGSCFDLVFPITLQFPDGTTATAADRSEMKDLARSWREDNPDVEGRPELVFPIEVEMEDGTLVTVNNAEELRELKDSCSGN